MSDILFLLAFITGIAIFILLLVSPMILLYLLGSHPNWQNKIGEFCKAKKKQIIIFIIIISCLFHLHLILSANKERALDVLFLAYLDTFIQYLIYGAIWCLIILIYRQVAKLIKKTINKDDADA